MTTPRTTNRSGRFLLTSAIVLFLGDLALLLLSKPPALGLLGRGPVTDPDLVVWTVVDLAAAALVFPFFSLYRRVWSYAGPRDCLALVSATTLRSLVTGGCLALLASPVAPAALVLEWLLATAALAGWHLAGRIMREWARRPAAHRGAPLLIVGAGEAGLRLLRELQDDPTLERRVVGLIDDDVIKQGRSFRGVRVLGGRESIPFLVRRREIEEVILALPSAPRSEVAEIVRLCSGLDVRCRLAPPRASLLDGLRFVDLEEIKPESFLVRNESRLDASAVASRYGGACVLVTGAAGSIGSELAAQVLEKNPRRLILLDRCENDLFRLEQRLLRSHPEADLVPVLLDILDEESLRRLLRAERPEVVFHAAAHKHVPMLEENPVAAVKNNVLGTWIVANAARDCGCSTFVQISTDKAVRPRNVMGATKAYGERIVRAMAEEGTDFRVVRFGNVLGSNGSVLGTFTQQVRSGGPVTVTDPDAERFLMSIDEAVRLVLAIGALDEPAGTYLLEMGEPVRILDLARRVIASSGLSEEEIPILYTGLRPGEKLTEELAGPDEVTEPAPLEGVMRLACQSVPLSRVALEIDLFRRAADTGDPVRCLQVLAACISHYRPAPEGAGRFLEPQTQRLAAPPLPNSPLRRNTSCLQASI